MSENVMFRIREYDSADHEAVIHLDKMALADLAVPGLPTNFDDLQEIETRYLTNGSFVVAEDGEEIVGMGAIRYIDQQTARINRMRVLPHHQRKGIARTILDWLEFQAEQAGKSIILLNTLAVQENAQRLYESHGYIKTGEGAPDGFRVFMYEKKIRAGV
jgi:GNAT superfamily N-acetyltransferase